MTLPYHPTAPIAPNPVLRHQHLSYLENAILALLAGGAPMTLPEIEAALYGQEFSFSQSGLALALVRLQELNLLGNTLAFFARRSA